MRGASRNSRPRRLCNPPAHASTFDSRRRQATRLQRHIQRALAERHMAAAALAHAGFDVLLTDTTHVFTRPIAPFLATAPSNADILAMRTGCGLKREPLLGCGFSWNFLLLRGSAGGDLARRERVVAFVQTAIDVGMVDFYLRWWAGHHCIFMGYVKMLKAARPRLVSILGAGSGGDGSRMASLAAPSAAANVQHANRSTAIVEVQRKGLCPRAGEPGACVRVAQLPFDLFPPPGLYHTYAKTALVGRTPRPDRDPARSHRLRLDRYDAQDFSELKQAMMEDSLWVLGDGTSRRRSAR